IQQLFPAFYRGRSPTALSLALRTHLPSSRWLWCWRQRFKWWWRYWRRDNSGLLFAGGGRRILGINYLSVESCCCNNLPGISKLLNCLAFVGPEICVPVARREKLPECPVPHF